MKAKFSLTMIPLLVALASFCHGGRAVVAELTFSTGFTSDMVLQRGPGRASVYGLSIFPVTVAVEGVDSTGKTVVYSVTADVRPGHSWKAMLNPAAKGGTYTITATAGTRSNSSDADASAGAGAESQTLERVTFGDVFLCSGQSNMVLEVQYTFSAATVKTAMAQGKYPTLRLLQFGGMQANTTLMSDYPRYASMLGKTPWYNATAAVVVPPPTEQGPGDPLASAYDHFSATCLYFGIELIDAIGDPELPIGLIQSAVGGSTIEAWMSNQTRRECTDLLPAKGGIGPSKSPLFPDMQHQPGALYYGYITPFVNMTISGWLWYQGENNCGGVMGNSMTGSGYGCELVAMVSAWRAAWSSTAGTTDPLAPFGIATLAAGGSEGSGEHMAGMRWSETGNYGAWNNAALPNTFGSQEYDLADPWAASGAGDGNSLNDFGNDTKCCKSWNGTKNAANLDCKARGQHGSCGDPYQCALPDPRTGKYGVNCSAWNESLWSPALRSVAPLVRLNAPSGIEGYNFMGGIHPRLKRPVGRRLAVAAVNLLPRYRTYAVSTVLKGQTAVTGPTLAGCSLGGSPHQQLALKFNKTMLGGEGLLLRPFDADMTRWQWRYDSSHEVLNKTDSAGLMVCTANGTAPPNPRKPQTGPVGNATTCQCQSWTAVSDNRTKNGGAIVFCEVGPGWKPDIAAFPLANRKPVHAPHIPFSAQWTAVPLTAAASNGGDGDNDVVVATADLSVLKGAAPLAVRLGWPMFSTLVGSADDSCCTSQPTFLGLAPCIPGNCPLYSSASELPANPFFAAITGDGTCACMAPQRCDA